jgi:hypothetical protein
MHHNRVSIRANEHTALSQSCWDRHLIGISLVASAFATYDYSGSTSRTQMAGNALGIIAPGSPITRLTEMSFLSLVM